MSTPALAVRDLVKLYRDKRRPEVLAGVRGVSLEVGAGEVVGLIGESGCGKTYVRALRGPADRRRIRARSSSKEKTFGAMTRSGLRRFRKQVQIVFQRPENCLNPRMTVFQFVREAVRSFGTRAMAASATASLETCRPRRPARATRSTPIRTSSAGARSSASPSCERSPATRRSSCSTSQPRRSTSRCRRRSCARLRDLQARGRHRVPVHQPRRGGDPLHVLAGVRHVSRRNRRGGADGARLRVARSIPIPARCSRPCRG